MPNMHFAETNADISYIEMPLFAVTQREVYWRIVESEDIPSLYSDKIKKIHVLAIDMASALQAVSLSNKIDADGDLPNFEVKIEIISIEKLDGMVIFDEPTAELIGSIEQTEGIDDLSEPVTMSAPYQGSWVTYNSRVRDALQRLGWTQHDNEL